MNSQKVCWTITDSFPGMKSQVMGLAEALHLPTLHKTCKRRWPWGWLNLPLGNPLNQLTPESDLLAPPWPDVVISCGRRSAALSLAIKKQTQGKTFCVHIQDPLAQHESFDLIVAPEHDHLKGDNVISTKGAIHKVTPQKLEEGVQIHGELFKDLPRPYSTVLLGGSTNRYTLSLKAMNELIKNIYQIQMITQGSVLVTPSFRTPFREVLRKEFSENPHVFLAEIETLNPYFAMVGVADFLFVTDDSISMMSEACMTGKPVYSLSLLGHKETKPKKFINSLIQEGTVRSFKGSIDTWTYTPFNDTEKVANLIRQKLAL